MNYPKISYGFALDCDGHLRADISNQNFIIKENGDIQDSVKVSCPPMKRHCCTSLSIIFDRNMQMGFGNPSGMEEAKNLCMNLLDEMDGLCDEATIACFKNKFDVLVPMNIETTVLKNGISSLKPDGEDKIWDAVYNGIAELVNNGTQECRSVIIFSNGIDSSSDHTVSDAISLASDNRLRVYAIGVGNSVNDSDLSFLANETGGRYFHDPTSLAMVELYKTISSVFYSDWGCDVSWITARCADGKVVHVEMSVHDLKDCSGSDTVTLSYKLPLDSANVYPIQIANKITDGIKDIVIPINISKPFHRDFTPASFNVLFDSSCIEFVGIENSGTLLNNIPVTWQRTTNGISITTQQTTFIDSSGTLLKLIFRTDQPGVEKECTLSLSDWTFNPECFVASLQSGKITIVKEVNVEVAKEAKSFFLSQNYPNPFTQMTNIEFGRRLAGTGLQNELNSLLRTPYSVLSFRVYDIFGREVLDLSKEVIGQSSMVIRHSQLPAQGIYFYRLTVGNESQTRMMMYFK